jgi:hypothetical protein
MSESVFTELNTRRVVNVSVAPNTTGPTPMDTTEGPMVSYADTVRGYQNAQQPEISKDVEMTDARLGGSKRKSEEVEDEESVPRGGNWKVYERGAENGQYLLEWHAKHTKGTTVTFFRCRFCHGAGARGGKENIEKVMAHARSCGKRSGEGGGAQN